MVTYFNVLDPDFGLFNPTYDESQDILGVGRYAFLVPDCPFNINLKRAGYIHDFRWNNAQIIQDFWDSAVEFKANCWLLARAQQHHLIADPLADLYYFGVSNRIAEIIFRNELEARGIIL